MKVLRCCCLQLFRLKRLKNVERSSSGNAKTFHLNWKLLVQRANEIKTKLSWISNLHAVDNGYWPFFRWKFSYFQAANIRILKIELNSFKQRHKQANSQIPLLWNIQSALADFLSINHCHTLERVDVFMPQYVSHFNPMFCGFLATMIGVCSMRHHQNSVEKHRFWWCINTIFWEDNHNDIHLIP